MVAGAGTMGRPKRGTKKKPVPPDDRVAIIHLKGSPEYRDWLNAMSDDSLIPVTSIVRDALSKWAKQRGYPEPPNL